MNRRRSGKELEYILGNHPKKEGACGSENFVLSKCFLGVWESRDIQKQCNK